MNLTTPIQLYNGKKDNVGNEIPLEKIIQTISGPSLKPYNLRTVYKALQLARQNDPVMAQKLQQQYDDGKGKLPAVTWAGTFTRRSAKHVKVLSGLMVFDIDKVSEMGVGDVTELRDLFLRWEYTFLCFLSPSGDGLKVIVKTDATALTFKNCFLALQEKIQFEFAISVDPSGKDVCRLCFLCYDPELFINHTSKTFTHQQEAITETKLNKAQQTNLQETGEDLYSVIHFTDKIKTYSPGNHNNYMHLFACNANRKGFSLEETKAFAVLHFNNKTQKEVEDTITSAFNHNSHEHAKFKKMADNNSAQNKSGVSQAASKKNATSMVGGKPVSHNGNSEDKKGTAGFTQFWKERVISKGRGKNKSEEKYIEIRRVEFTDFLFDLGFHLIETDGETYQICHTEDGIVTPVDARRIKKKVFEWCKKNGSRDIEEQLRRNQKQLFALNEMDSLHTKDIEIKTDTETESFYYFKNCWVTVTAEKITTHPYSELNGHIWAGNKKSHSFTYEEPKLLNDNGVLEPAAINSEFARFVYYVSYNPNNEGEKYFGQEIIEKRFESHCSTLGYMLDGYKHPSDRKAVFAIDHKIGESGEKNGRSGKSIYPQACRFLKVTSTINGKTFDPRYPFRFEPITADSQIINFNDMKDNVDPEEIFEMVTDDYSVLRRNNGYLYFKYQNSPKIYYSANGVPKGEGASYRARMHVIEFSDYFTPEYTPFNEFKHGLFGTDWDDQEWNRFYNFLLWCVQCVKANGLIKYPNSNFEARKMNVEVDEEFRDFMDNKLHPASSVESGKAILNNRVKKIDLLAEFRIVYKNLANRDCSAKKFTTWLKKYCKHQHLFFNPQLKGAFDKVAGVEYYTIADHETFDPGSHGQVELFPDSMMNI